MITTTLETINRAPLASLDDLARATWATFAAGAISDAEAAEIAEGIERRRGSLRRPAPGLAVVPPVSMVREQEPHLSTLTDKRPAPLLPRHGLRQLVLRVPALARYDRGRSMVRKRTLAASGPMPPRLAAAFTTGEQAVLAIVAAEVREHGSCTRTIAELAARSGTSDSTVKRAVRQAVRLGLVTVEERRRPGRKNLPNVIRIVSADWRAWIERRGTERVRQSGEGSRTGGQKRNPTDIKGFSGRLKGMPAQAGQRFASRALCAINSG